MNLTPEKVHVNGVGLTLWRFSCRNHVRCAPTRDATARHCCPRPARRSSAATPTRTSRTSPAAPAVAVGTLYRHFETREALIEEVYRKEVDDLCATPGVLLDQHAPEEALRRFLLLLVDHAAVGKGMSSVLESIMATDSHVFDDARTRMADALSLLLEVNGAVSTVRDDVTGSTLLRALGGICGMRATEGWLVEARQITALLFDGLRHGAPQSP